MFVPKESPKPPPIHRDYLWRCLRRGVSRFRNDAGLNCHRSCGYLVHPRVGEEIARWWRGEGA